MFYNKKTRNLCRNLHKYILLIIMTFTQPANFGGEWSWPANLWKDLKVESTLII